MQLLALLQALPRLPQLQAQARSSRAWRGAALAQLHRALRSRRSSSHSMSTPAGLLVVLAALGGTLFGEAAVPVGDAAEREALVQRVYALSVGRLSAYRWVGG